MTAHARTDVPSAVGRASSGGKNCPECGHDNTIVTFPTFSRLRNMLGVRQALPYCAEPDEFPSGFGGGDACGCKHSHHQSFTV